jgi:type IV pilus assembly protein PilB
VPVAKHDHTIAVALADPSDLDVMDTLQRLVNADVECAWPRTRTSTTRSTSITARPMTRFPKMIQDITEGEVEVGPQQRCVADDGATVEADAPIIKLVNTLIVEAFKARASDIHLEPLTKTFRVRYRIDGVLHEMKSPPKRLQASIISRLKIQSNMSIAERRIPQDGRIQTSSGGQADRPARLLHADQPRREHRHAYFGQGRAALGLPELGFFTDDQQTFERLIGLPDGILLVTGPTGSGKTTTLYSCLNFINRPDRKIITVEDPVEYLLAGINQVQVSETVGLTFAAWPCAPCCARRPT